MFRPQHFLARGLARVCGYDLTFGTAPQPAYGPRRREIGIGDVGKPSERVTSAVLQDQVVGGSNEYLRLYRGVDRSAPLTPTQTEEERRRPQRPVRLRDFIDPLITSAGKTTRSIIDALLTASQRCFHCARIR